MSRKHTHRIWSRISIASISGRMRTTVTLIALALGAALAGAIMLFSGTYNIAATVQHYRPTYWALHLGMRRSVETHARSVKVPPLDEPALARKGLALYHA